MLDIEIISHVASEINENLLRDAIASLLKEYRILRAEISVAVVDDATIHQINRDFLRHDWPTDVITFPGTSPDESGLLSGELIVSWETAQREAAESGLPLMGELLLYVIHGTLHLLGLDDDLPASATKMRIAERKALESLGFSYRFDDQVDLEP